MLFNRMGYSHELRVIVVQGSLQAFEAGKESTPNTAFRDSSFIGAVAATNMKLPGGLNSGYSTYQHSQGLPSLYFIQRYMQGCPEDTVVGRRTFVASPLTFEAPGLG